MQFLKTKIFYKSTGDKLSKICKTRK